MAEAYTILDNVTKVKGKTHHHGRAHVPAGAHSHQQTFPKILDFTAGRHNPVTGLGGGAGLADLCWEPH